LLKEKSSEKEKKITSLGRSDFCGDEEPATGRGQLSGRARQPTLGSGLRVKQGQANLLQGQSSNSSRPAYPARPCFDSRDRPTETRTKDSDEGLCSRRPAGRRPKHARARLRAQIGPRSQAKVAAGHGGSGNLKGCWGLLAADVAGAVDVDTDEAWANGSRALGIGRRETMLEIETGVWLCNCETRSPSTGVTIDPDYHSSWRPGPPCTEGKPNRASTRRSRSASEALSANTLVGTRLVSDLGQIIEDVQSGSKWGMRSMAYSILCLRCLAVLATYLTFS
jgi:hypothetical protein